MKSHSNHHTDILMQLQMIFPPMYNRLDYDLLAEIEAEVATTTIHYELKLRFNSKITRYWAAFFCHLCLGIF